MARRRLQSSLCVIALITMILTYWGWNSANFIGDHVSKKANVNITNQEELSIEQNFGAQKFGGGNYTGARTSYTTFGGSNFGAQSLIDSSVPFKSKTKRSDDCEEQFVSPEQFEGFNNITGTRNGCKVVPNLVHFVQFQRRSFTFGSAVCILAALKNQKPDRILVHTDVPVFKGRYWKMLTETPGFSERLIVVRRSFPDEIFAKRTTSYKIFHASDITRIRALMEYGGIYLDTDACIVRSLDKYRKYEMTIGWSPHKSMRSSVMIAHKNARFLRDYLDSYRLDYQPKKLFHNAVDVPTKKILGGNPHFVHRVENLFGDEEIFKKLYLERFPEWKSYYVLHTRVRRVASLKKNAVMIFGSSEGFSKGFNETNILAYPVAYRELVKSVWPQKLNVTPEAVSGLSN